jgi:cell division transport system permease protein
VNDRTDSTTGGIVEDQPRKGGREPPLLPAASIAGRSLIIVIAIMTFLACVTAGTVELIASAAGSWRQDISREATIQVRPIPGRDIDRDVARARELASQTRGVTEVRALDKSQSGQLLEPFLGQGLDLADLPIPRLITLRLSGGAHDLGGLRERLQSEIANAQLDDHRLWLARLGAMAAALVAVGVVMLLLVLTATGLAIAFATRGAMAGNRAIIEVLDLVGATDGFIAREFQRHFLRLGLKGGAIGGAAAVLLFWTAGALAARYEATPGGDQIEALFGTFALGLRGYAAIVLIAFIVAVTAAIVSRVTVYRNLRGLD